jgi:F420-non-reducing hydrogenase small subunit
VPKKNLAVHTATGCRTCELSLLDIHYQVQRLHRVADIVYWPYLLGSQHADLARIESIDVCFFAGAVRTSGERQMAEQLRAKSRLMVALGACAGFGGMPGLANLVRETGSLQAAPPANPPSDPTPELPAIEPQVASLTQVVAVDYVVPGCPPTQNLVWSALQGVLGEGGSQAHLAYAAGRLPKKVAQAMASGVQPPLGTVFAGEKAVCASCSRVKEQKRFESVKRPYQAYESTGRCLLEQGLVCSGIATREGCGGLCTGVGIPCRGCFGKPEAVYDPGAKMVAAISSTFDAEKPQKIDAVVDQFLDLTGTFYRYTLPTQCALLSIQEKS